MDRLSEEDKKMQSELSDEEDSTSRNTSLSETSRGGQPSVTAKSARDKKTEAAPLKSKSEKAGSEKWSSRRTGENEGSQVSRALFAHILENEHSL